MATHSNVPAWNTPWTKSLLGYSPWGHKELDTTEHAYTHTHTHTHTHTRGPTSMSWFLQNMPLFTPAGYSKAFILGFIPGLTELP